MGRWSRRRFLTTSLGASAAVVAAGKVPLAAAQAGKSAADTSPAATRERLLMDFGWRFQLGHASDPAKDFDFGALDREATYAKSGEIEVASLRYDDSWWRTLDLPHDWAVELPFVNAEGLPDHGGKPLGREFPETSVGWYRRSFEIPAAAQGKRFSVEFDGVFRDASVFCNGHYVGENFSGYAPFRFDLSDILNYGGKNVVTVRVDASLSEGWFYEGAGIYRHVWMTVTDPVHVAQWGTFVKSEVRALDARVTVQTEVENESDREANCRVVSRIIAPDGSTAATATSASSTVAASGKHTFTATAVLSSARLWSLEERNLYRVESTLEANGRAVDHDTVNFGVRTIRFDADKGFFLNGEAVKIKGTCNHQDHAGVGAALPDRLQSYRIERLKDMACNAYRTSHNPPTPELLDACDRLGMLVLDETRMMDSSREGLSQLARLVRRDRNHPCVVLWSLGNEEPEQGTERGARIMRSMKRLAYQLDGTRPVTMAMNGGWGKGVSGVVDVQGFNYYGPGGGAVLAKNMDQFHRDFPKQPCVGTETASEQMTRGIYANDKERGYVSAYDVNFPRYTTSAQDWWKVYDERPWLAGGFAWTGFDYRGEPSPYEWPCISSHFGAMDTCGFPKDVFYYYKSAWTDEPVLHLFPYWNWKDGQEIDVWCYTNLDEVELLVNGRSLGTKKAVRDGHLSWKVPYAAGMIEARGSRGGKVLTAKRETTGAPAAVRLTPDRNSIQGDGEDVAVVTVEIVDAQGRVVPVADHDVQFTVTGPGRVIGVGNGDPSSHEPDKGDRRRAFNGLCCAIVQGNKEAGEIRIEATSAGLQGGSARVEVKAAQTRAAVA